jgi:hypothetical protein
MPETCLFPRRCVISWSKVLRQRHLLAEFSHNFDISSNIFRIFRIFGLLE